MRRKMTSRSSKHGANDSNVFFIVLIATYFLLVRVFNDNDNSCYTYHSSSTCYIGPCGPCSGQHDATKRAIANFFDHLKSVFEGHRAMRCSLEGIFVRDSHVCSRLSACRWVEKLRMTLIELVLNRTCNLLRQVLTNQRRFG